MLIGRAIIFCYSSITIVSFLHRRLAMFQLTVRDDLSEVIAYTSPNVPIRAVQGTLSHFPNKAAVCHWHSDLECIIVLEGAMHYFVNEQVYQLTPGTGIIVNANRLHFGYGVDERDCVFLVLLLHPSLLSGNVYIESHYLNPLLYDANSDAILLSEEVTWQHQALLLIKTMVQLGQEQPPHYEFQIPIQFASLWLLLYKHAVANNGSHQHSSASSSHLKEMIGYIQKHYSEKISLHDIASAGFLVPCKRCRLVKKNPHQKPR